ncbi:MAG: hypothetical protein ACHQSE_15080 [Gemmatimonadales bacterium]|jgi:hypothetical protein
MSSADHTRSAAAIRSAVVANVALLVLLAAFPVLTPDRFLAGFGISNAPFAVFGLVRVFAVFSIVLATVVWSARDWLQSPAGRPAVVALTGAYAFGALLLFTQQWAVWYGRSGVGLTLGCAALAFSYGKALTKSSVDVATRAG